MVKTATSSSAKKSKKRSTAPVSVSLVVNEPDPLVDPLVVSFPSGVPTEKPKFAWKPINEKRPKNGRIVVGSDSSCVYHGQNKGRGHDGRRTKLLVGIWDKQTNSLTLHQAAQRGTRYSLTQSVPTYKPHVEDLQQTMSAVERHRALFESFGSAKKRKVLKSQQANVVNVDSVVGAGSVMMDALQKQKMSESNRQAMRDTLEGNKTDAVETAYAEARKKFLPNYDEDATEPHLVYDARNMAGDDAWGRLGRVMGACLHKAGENENWINLVTSRGNWFDSVSDLLKQVPPHSPHAKYQVKCAILMNHMIRFYSRTREGGVLRGNAQKLEQVITIPTEILYRFLDVFATNFTDDKTGREGYATSKQDRDKCRLQILLLYLMAAGGQSMKVGNILPVVQDLKMEPAEAANLLRAAGCTVTKRGPNVWSAALTVPLTFPPPKQRARGGGGR